MATVANHPPVGPVASPSGSGPIPPAGSITLRGVAWSTYCQVRDAAANDHVRMSYLDGALTLMAPALRHDRPAEVLGLIVRAVSAASGLEILGIRSTTLRRDRGDQRGEGKEADAAFYVGAD